MEFPDTGTYCAAEGCGRLDFLPVFCSSCQQDFCKEHYLPDDHKCPSYPRNADRSAAAIPSYQCSICCKKELVPILCRQCQVQVCLDHRHQPNHHCIKWEEPKERMVETKKVVDQIVEKNASKRFIGARGAKSDKLAAKVQLMKLKQRSQGLKELPAEERIYFMVEGISNGGKTGEGVFVSKLWSVGKCIDVMASLCHLANHNNVSGKPQLNMFNSAESCLSERKDEILSNLIDQEVIFNGQSVWLKYVQPSNKWSIIDSQFNCLFDHNYVRTEQEDIIFLWIYLSLSSWHTPI